MMPAAARLPVEVVVPLRWDAGSAMEHAADVAEMTGYLSVLARWVDVTVVDGSGPGRYAEHSARWSGSVRHLPPSEEPALGGANGKVVGAMTGVRAARHERVVLADDDVRYDLGTLQRVVRGLDTADLVRPQNVFDAWPWHARWDAARTLVGRGLGGGDWPGTFAVRRSVLLRTGGWDADVLFENLELVRTVAAAGGRVRTLDVPVRRRPPAAGHFWGQRVRQAYDDLAQPWRLVPSLAVLPVVAASVRRPRRLLALWLATVAVAEHGRRGSLADVVPRDVPLWAPAWVLERGVCSWLALAQRARGGVPYRGRRLRTAAHSRAQIVRRLEQRTPADPVPRAR